MKLIEALKAIERLQRKGDDIKKLIKDHCATSNLQPPTYAEPDKKISGWLQAHTDIVAEVLRLRIAIAKTNLATMVTIDLGNNKSPSKSIAEWIHRRRDLSKQDHAAWANLTDRGIQNHTAKGPGDAVIEVKIQRHFDPTKRDEMKDMYLSEPSIIDGRLEVVNAITDLIED